MVFREFISTLIGHYLFPRNNTHGNLLPGYLQTRYSFSLESYCSILLNTLVSWREKAHKKFSSPLMGAGRVGVKTFCNTAHPPLSPLPSRDGRF